MGKKTVDLEFIPDDRVFIIHENTIQEFKVVGYRVTCEYSGGKTSYPEKIEYKLDIPGAHTGRNIWVEKAYSTKEELIKSL